MPLSSDAGNSTRNVKKGAGREGGGLARRVDTRVGASAALRKSIISSKRRREDVGMTARPAVTLQELDAMIAQFMAETGVGAVGEQNEALKKLRMALSADDDATIERVVDAGCIPVLEKYCVFQQPLSSTMHQSSSSTP